jgi:hypothetical protein
VPKYRCSLQTSHVLTWASAVTSVHLITKDLVWTRYLKYLLCLTLPDTLLLCHKVCIVEISFDLINLYYMVDIIEK